MAGLQTLRHRYWMPTTIFLIGMLSILLLLWVDRINAWLHADADLVDAIMDVQIHAASGHLWLEHLLMGEIAVTKAMFTSELDQAIHLVDVTLEGGATERDWIVEPLSEPHLRANAREIRSGLEELKTIGLTRLEHPETAGTGSALHLRFDTVYRDVLSRARELEETIETDETVNAARSERLFLAITAIWGGILIVVTVVLYRGERRRRATEESLQRANERLREQAEELKEHREHLAELVERRNSQLKATYERVRTEMAERLQVCETLQEKEQQVGRLSASLLKAQESERRRISMELHDELGQALNVMKLQLRAVERALEPDQESVRTDCENLLEYINQVIEDVRRLSLYLSPTVLEDLGLTAALRWLVGNLAKHPELKVTTEIAAIDRLVPREHWITIYRVVQEALTNIVKHAQAQNVAVTIQQHDGRVDFLIEEDCKGFDPEQAAAKDVTEKSLGLGTMNERVRIVDGEFELWSRRGEGTRILFSLPTGVETKV